MNTNLAQPTTSAAPPGAARTVAEALGQIVWLLSQSAAHRALPIKALEWSFMPAILTEQFRIFRFGPLPGLKDLDLQSLQAFGLAEGSLEQLPLGVAIWAHLSATAEAKLEAGEHLSPQEWRSGDRLWLIELISPFATRDNKLTEAMLLDLIQGPFATTPFNLHRTDPATGRRDKVHMVSHIQRQ